MLDRPSFIERPLVQLNEPMPDAVEAEQALLGAAMINRDAVSATSDLVDPDDFGEQIHSRIWAALTQAAANGESTSPIVIAPRLGVSKNNELPGTGMTVFAYLARLCAEATTVINAADYARSIREAANRRRNISAGLTLIERSMGGDHPRTTAAEVIAELDVIAAAAATSTPRVSIGRASESALAASREASERKQQFNGASWGIPSLNRATRGMTPGAFVVAAGRTGMGKSTFGLAVSLKTAAAGHGAYFVSLEMIDQELGSRALAATAYSADAPLSYESIAKGDLTAVQFDRLASAQARLNRLPIEIEQEPSLSVAQIKARARRVAQDMEKAGRKLEVIIVDHIGLVRVSDRYRGSKPAEIAEVTAELKVLAKSAGVCVIGLVQLSRAVEGRDDKRPSLADLKWSGSIEEDADVVIGLYREAYYLNKKANKSEEEINKLIDTQNKLEAVILKNRGGREQIVDLFCDIGCNVIDDQMRAF